MDIWLCHFMAPTARVLIQDPCPFGLPKILTTTPLGSWTSSGAFQPRSWHLSSVRNLSGMFMRASSFDQPLVWDTWAVKDFSFMFQEADGMGAGSRSILGIMIPIQVSSF